LHPLPPLDDDGELSRVSAHPGGSRPQHADHADPTGDPAADSGRLVAAGASGDSAAGGPVRRAGALLSLAQCRPRGGRAVWQDPGDHQARREAAYAARRNLPADLGDGGDRRVSGYPAGVAGNDSVSDRALVLLSGAYRRAVSSFLKLCKLLIVNMLQISVESVDTVVYSRN